MTPVTVFLVVLIVALVIGNALLFLFWNGRPSFRIGNLQASGPFHAAGSLQVLGQRAKGQKLGELPSTFFAGKMAPLETKVELAHRRIQELEEKLNSMRYSNGSVTDEALKRKIDKLDSFRSIANSELVAMKEILTEMQERRSAAKPRAYRAGRKPKEIPEGRLHKIIYRSDS